MGGSISKFAERMRWWCEQGNLGYDQSNRWDIRVGGECDCSSLIIFALREAGFDTGSASYTGNLSSNLTSRGWQRLSANLSTCRVGDILLNDANHVCAVVSGSGTSAKIAQASIDERGRISGGASGDQTGGETNVRTVYAYRSGWDCILRYAGADAPAATPSLDLGDLAWWGPAFTREAQRQLGTPVDGVVSGQSTSSKRHHVNCSTNSWRYGSGGSTMMRALQRKLMNAGHDAGGIDGLCGPRTIMALQSWLGVTVDGFMGPQTCTAVGNALYAGKFK